MSDGLLAEKENFVDVVVLFGTGSYAGVNFLEFIHDREHLTRYHLRRRSIGLELRLVCAKHDRYVDAQRAEVWHPKKCHALIAVMVRVY